MTVPTVSVVILKRDRWLAEEGRVPLAPDRAPETIGRYLEEMAKQPRRTCLTPTWDGTGDRVIASLETAA